jgi:hypothetical protein
MLDVFQIFVSENSLHWIKPKNSQASENATQFHPLPWGEGRGEGEVKAINRFGSKFTLLKSVLIPLNSWS